MMRLWTRRTLESLLPLFVLPRWASLSDSSPTGESLRSFQSGSRSLMLPCVAELILPQRSAYLCLPCVVFNSWSFLCFFSYAAMAAAWGGKDCQSPYLGFLLAGIYSVRPGSSCQKQPRIWLLALETSGPPTNHQLFPVVLIHIC